nr:potassium:proton antiporter [uncultured Pseudodesulfovibrio sp.]
MAILQAIIYIKSMLKNMGILAWIGCLITLAYQSVSWAISAVWPSVTLLDVLRSFFGLDLLSFVTNLPLDMAAKAVYICFTTQLTLFFWWMGVALFVTQLLTQIFIRK